MEKDFEDVVKETLNKLYEEEGSEDNGQPEQESGGPQEPETPSEPQEPQGQEDNQEPQDQETNQDEPPNDDENEEGEGEKEEEESFSAKNFDDFLKQTESKITVTADGCMPSPIFGNRDTQNHNKFLVKIENKKGSVSFTYWDSVANTKAKKPLDSNDAMADFGSCIMDYEGNPSPEGFKKAFGYDETEEDIAQKAYTGCRQMFDNAKKMFTKAQLEELKRLASEY